MSNPNLPNNGQMPGESIPTVPRREIAAEVIRGRFVRPSYEYGAATREVRAVELFCAGDFRGVDDRDSGEISGETSHHIGDLDYVLQENASHGLRVVCEAGPLYPHSVTDLDAHGRVTQVEEQFPRSSLGRDKDGQIRPMSAERNHWNIDDATSQVQGHVRLVFFTDTKRWEEVERSTRQEWLAQNPQGAISRTHTREDDPLRYTDELRTALWEPSFVSTTRAYNIARLQHLCDQIAALSGQDPSNVAFRVEPSLEQGGISIVHDTEFAYWVYHFAPADDGTTARLVAIEGRHKHPIMAPTPEYQRGLTLNLNGRHVDRSIKRFQLDANGTLISYDKSVHFVDEPVDTMRTIETMTRAEWEQTAQGQLTRGL